MPCIPFREHGRTSFLCIGNDPVSVEYRGKTYLFEWTAASGWIPVNRDSSQRLSRVPKGAWDVLLAENPEGSE